ncbi:glycosyltransferase [Agrococcus jejuensis]|uniref:4,4'-diaponeurosporenoate glycosyltransferase n=1 Tax=Agrococcus jejuensis TaxID=399736 RepID=A0A1G8DRS0_9MICO|nr:glycosyltransferase [Agrococcus jejuensis]SDH60352.1 Glycosyl transferase family 2 [Agrococcus jejuensis]
MTRIREVRIVVPARDEAERIDRCLAAIAIARATVEALGVRTRCVVVADACRDDTAALAAAHERVDVVVTDAARVGVARHVGVDAAGDDGHGTDPAAVWIASTDADSVVPADWLAVHLGHADRGADVVLGLVHLPPGHESAAALARWHARSQQGDRIHGANLGVRLDAYRAVGGFPPLAAHEDVSLVAALVDARRRVVPTARASVRTSGRAEGRAPSGFARHLRTIVLGDVDGALP